jgi:hypothetical protein
LSNVALRVSVSGANHHCGGGVYGTTAGGAAPYVTGAVAHGSQAGAGGGQGGGQAATAGFGKHQLQQPQPAQLTATSRKAERSDILFIMCLLTGNFRCLYYGQHLAPVRCCHCARRHKIWPLNHTRHAMMCKRNGRVFEILPRAMAPVVTIESTATT